MVEIIGYALESAAGYACNANGNNGNANGNNGVTNAYYAFGISPAPARLRANNVGMRKV